MLHDTHSIHAPPEGAFSSIKNLASSLVSHLHTRWQLFATELAEEKLRLVSLLFSAVLALFFTCMTLVVTVLFVIAIYWDTPYRLHALGLLGLLFLVGAGIFATSVRTKLRSKPRLFEASLAELYKDREQLKS